MESGSSVSWRRWLSILVIQVVGCLTMLYGVGITVGLIAMTVMIGTQGSFEVATDFDRAYFPTGNATLLCAGEVLLLSCAGLIFFSGMRMVRDTRGKGLAEFSCVLAFWIAAFTQSAVRAVLGPIPFVAFVASIAVYLIIRFKLVGFLKRRLGGGNHLEADPSTSSR